MSDVVVIVAVRADDANVWRYDHHGRPDYSAPVHDQPQGVSEAIVQAVTEEQQIWASREALATLFEPPPTLQGISDAADAIEAADTTVGGESGDRRDGRP